MNYPDMLRVILKNESGYVNDSDDRGGETFCGISRKGWPSASIWSTIDRYKPQFKSNIIPRETTFSNDKNLHDNVYNFYYTNYFLKLKIDTINDPKLAMHVLDMSLGGNKSRDLLKTMYNVGSLDAAITKVNSDPTALQKFIEARKVFYKQAATAPKQSKFLKGWLNRVDYVCQITGSLTYSGTMPYNTPQKLSTYGEITFNKVSTSFKKVCSTCGTS